MVAWRLRLRRPGIELVAAAAVAGITALLTLAGVHKLGAAGIALPLVLVVAAIVIARPLFATALVVVLTILCESPPFGLFTFTKELYASVYHDITVLDVFVAMAILSVGLDVVRHRRPLWVPRPLALPLAVLALAMIAGVVTGHAAGASLKFALFAEHILAYLLLLPLAVANLDLGRRQLRWALAGAMALALLKAVLGLVEVFGHFGAPIEGTTTLTYYEPAPNWLVMVAVLSVAALLVARARPPRWVLLGSPLLLACLILSYRRSFWIGAFLGLVLVVVIGTSPSARRLLAPIVLGLAASILLLGSIHFQSQLPVAKRLASLSPTKLESNAQDRYRLDERANVWGAISEHPITGLGMTIPWQATVQPLSIEHEEGREYVHFAALWFWLKLGILGLAAYIAVILGAVALAWRAWRAARDPFLKAFAIASMCATVGLVAMDTTASFTGVDGRFTVLFSAQLGLLALILRTAGEVDESAGPEPPAEDLRVPRTRLNRPVAPSWG